MSIQVIDNFLPESIFKKIQSELMGNSFPWYYYQQILLDHPESDSKKYQFVHQFYKEESQEKSFSFSIIEPLIIKLNVKKIIRIKSNLTPRHFEHRNSGYHIDGCVCPLTSIFYINTNNGWTEFRKGDRVDCKENRILIFDSNLEHTAVTCTDENVRVVVNLNYE